MPLRRFAPLLAFVGVAATATVFDAAPATQDPVAAAAPLARGAKVTFVRPGEGGASVSVRARLVALAVERGEVPHPALAPGMFRARFVAKVTLPLRDRYDFRVDGRGAVELRINGEKVLGGSPRPQKPLATDKGVRLKKGENLVELDFESGALGDGWFRLLWKGPDFAFEPIAPELLQWDAADPEIAAGERLRHGHQLFVDRRCALCHEPQARRVGESAYAELDAPGPDLRQVGARAKRPWIAAWLQDPRRFRKDATMPRMHLASDQEAHDMAAYLGSLGAPVAAPEPTAEQRTDGARRFLELGCVACHTGVGEGLGDAALGDRIDLSFVPQKWHAAGLVAYLQDPRRNHAHVRMPDFRLTADDAAALAAHLLAAPAEALPDAVGDVERGRRLVQQRDCLACHALDVPPAQERVTKRLGHLDAQAGCLADAPGKAGKAGKAPDHGLSDEQRAALRAFLPLAEEAPFRRAPLDFVARHRPAERCTACHGLDGEPSTWARWATAAGATVPLPHEQDPLAQGIPALSWVGEKLQPSWLKRFVLGEEKSPRPWLTARMPVFHQHGDAIVQGLVREHGYAQDEPRTAADAQLAIHGDRLVQMGTGFGCVQCHALGDKPAVQVFERAGIELLTARARLRHEYYSRWLLDPPRIDPDARMTKYADDKGRTAFTDVLGGDAAKQFEAIWQFLGSRVR